VAALAQLAWSWETAKRLLTRMIGMKDAMLLED